MYIVCNVLWELMHDCVCTIRYTLCGNEYYTHECMYMYIYICIIIIWDVVWK